MLRIPYLGFSSSLNRVSFPFDIRGSNNCLDLMTVHGDTYNAVPAAHIWNIQNYSCPVSFADVTEMRFIQFAAFRSS